MPFFMRNDIELKGIVLLYADLILKQINNFNSH